ncbi:MAG: hypothetical protein CK431_10220 [Mycobacterium sp.]|nr:MAG: hypothetical protein CK431_10220 [Mycobacterium sp.]
MSDGVLRDKWGRPYIYPPPARGKTHADVIKRYQDRGKLPKPYRRTTKFISPLEDTYNLEKWAERNVARGVAERDDLIARARTCAPGDSDELNAVAAAAKSHMRTGLLRDLGSYEHYCTDLIDRHGDDTDLPSPGEYASLRNSQAGRTEVDITDDDLSLEERNADLDAYRAVKQRYGLRFSHIEQMRVFDPWEVAGTPDRIGTGTDDRFGGKWLVEDLKTGDIDWANKQREYAMQFAMYAHSTAYDPAVGRYDDVPPVDRDRAVLIHLPVGQARCELHFVDIARGWDGCLRARAVWEWRKETGLFTRLDEWQPPTHLERLANNPTYAEAAMMAPTVEALRELWARAADHPGALSDSFKAAVKKRLEELESKTGKVSA